MENNATTSNARAAVDRVAMRVPPFWAADLEVWFSQLESQFAIAGITTDDTKYNYVVGSIDAQYVTEVRDILARPPADGKYEKIKTELIRRLSVSQQQKTRRLLEHEEIGDRRPSQFLRHLQGLAGTTVPDDLMRSLWLGRLPSSMQAILATQSTTELSKVAELADAIAETHGRQHVSAVSGEDLETRIATMIASMRKEITSEILAAVSTSGRASENRRNRYRSRSTSRSRGIRDSGLCFYRDRFGDAAKKCRPPCSRSSENARGSQ